MKTDEGGWERNRVNQRYLRQKCCLWQRRGQREKNAKLERRVLGNQLDKKCIYSISGEHSSILKAWKIKLETW